MINETGDSEMLNRLIRFFDTYPFVKTIIGVILIVAAIWILIRVNRTVFRNIRKKHEGLNPLFFERMITAILLLTGAVLVITLVFGESSVWKTVLGGTALISAVLAFAAQDVIKDILGGLMLTVYKPFEIGNRVELEDGTVGIVRDITMRHVILDGLDTQKIVIPNSKINLMRLRNFSFHSNNRSAHFTFYIAYGSDIEHALQVIKEAIMSSPYSIPGKETPEGAAYADVYFMAYEECALRLQTTVYYAASTPSEKAISDINLRVDEALRRNHIEIPYPYLNVIHKTETAGISEKEIRKRHV